MLVVAATQLATLDWLVLAGYFLLLAGSGVFFALRAKRTTSEYFLAAHSMPVWAVAISILATAQSAATFTGAPEQSYLGDLSYLAINLGNMIAAVVLALVFIPAYYKQGVSTPYQLLEARFGPGAKLAASWAYMIGRVFASGSRVFIGAIPVSIAIFGDRSAPHLVIAVGVFMAFGIVYTLAGGITSVIWTDVLQVGVYLGAVVLAIALLAGQVTAPWSEVVDALRAGAPDGGSKLALIRSGLAPGDGPGPGTGFDFSQEINLATILTGFVLMALASYGTDQDLVQRMLTCKDRRAGGRAVIHGMLVGVPAVAIFMLFGLLLWVYYQRPDLMGGAGAPVPPEKSSDLVLTYILSSMPAGAAGLMIAGVMAAGPAGINSGLNSMASTFVSDVYRPARPGRDERHYVRVGRLAVAGWGVVLGVFALLCVWWFEHSRQTIIGFVLSVMTFAYAGLLGVFFTALFTRRGSTRSCIAAMIVGFAVVVILRPEVWEQWTRLLGLPRAWQELRIAWPWGLVAGTLASTLACGAASGKARAA